MLVRGAAGSVLAGALVLAACAGGAKPERRDGAAAPTAPAVGSGRTLAPARGGAINQDLVRRGYRAQMHDGQIVYCRREAETGTRLASYVCRSEARIKSEEEEARQALGPAGVNRTTGCPVGQVCR